MCAAWDALGGNPAPGDSGWVLQQGSQLATIANEAGAAEQQLRAIADSMSDADWSGPAATVFKGMLHEAVLTDLGALVASYTDAGSALGTFGWTLQNLQNEAAAALRSANTAVSELAAANGQIALYSSEFVQAEARGNTARSAITGVLRALVLRGVVHSTSVAVSTASSMVSSALHGALGADYSTLQSLQSQLWTASAALSNAEADESAAQQALGRARQLAAEAQIALSSARATAGEIATAFQQAAQRAATQLQGASQAGLHNLSFWGRIGKDLTSIVKFEESTLGNIVAAMGGNFTGIESEVHKALEVGAVVVHEAASIVHDAARITADVMSWAAPILTVVAIIAAVTGQEEIAAAALGLREAATVIQLSAEAIEVESSAVEVGTDELQGALGDGNNAQLQADEKQGERDFVGLVASGVGYLATQGVGNVLPDASDVVESAMNGEITGVGAGVLVGSEGYVDDVTSTLVTVPFSRPNIVAVAQGFS